MHIATATTLSRRPRKSWSETVLAAGATVGGIATSAPLAASSETVGSRIGLAEVVQTVVELNRNRASRRDVRLHAYVVDQLVPTCQQSSLIGKLDTLVARTILNAAWGSAITCQAAIEAGEARVLLSFAKPVADGHCEDASVDCIDELWSWRVSDAVPGHH